ncbi:hypothetical protein P175DRAFT_0448610 [Aspergillus ochraceoroseus IBT 24754]|uniref:Tyrosine specific protein phosphatases domain-containing protein n=2 Tax=Aspergillus ochraceoroseus TaxID=138278 RepID=A0A2T5MAT8_9EURO|nr:uncharacterized protein P175DRAFT_0448610 [Aspergillus ochraceoroseus IBT 24754]KKK23565.1 hypothetical protein AOCH_007269 [Aspergillus ochraceoroseus]PTU25658.1 hypothetical protein P175DRAFT_0448610 [Aspergillus ochraceoroseus IBT 24754]
MGSAYNIQELIETYIQIPLPELAVQEVISKAPFVTVPGLFNLRDISNVTSGSSQFPPIIRPGLIYRAAAPPPTVSEDGKTALTNLGITKLYDLRRPDERVHRPSPIVDGIEVVWVPYAGEAPRPGDAHPNMEKGIESMIHMYMGYLELLLPHFKLVFEHIRDAPQKPLLFHCSAGKDRTGVLAALIQRLAGSPDDAIIQDYTLTRIGIEPGRESLTNTIKALYGTSAIENPMQLVSWGVNAATMTGFLKAVDDTHGGVEGYLKENMGFSDKDVQIMIHNLRQDATIQ